MSHLPFNGLSLAETERLDILIEELGEVLQAIGKIKRHGWKPTDHTTGIVYDNRGDLQTELGHVRNAMELMASKGDIDEMALVRAAVDKASRWGPYLHHQGEEGSR